MRLAPHNGRFGSYCENGVIALAGGGMGDMNLVRAKGNIYSEALFIADVSAGYIVNVNAHAHCNTHIVTHTVHLYVAALGQRRSAGSAYGVVFGAVKNMAVGA